MQILNIPLTKEKHYFWGKNIYINIKLYRFIQNKVEHF